MKIRHLFLTGALLLMSGATLPGSVIPGNSPKAEAAGGIELNATLTPSATSATVGQAVSVSVYTWAYQCNELYDGKYYPFYGYVASDCNAHQGVKGKKGFSSNVSLSVSGGATLSASQLTTNSSGQGSFTVNSSVGGSMTVKAQITGISAKAGGSFDSAAITFSSPAAVPAATSSSSSKPAPAQTKKPAVKKPTVTTIKVGGKTVSIKKPVTVKVGQSLVLSGKTVPKGIVKLYIHSKLRTATVKADSKGVWEYTIDQLPVGKHSVDAQVTDPSTKKKSAKASLLDFTIKPSGKTIALASAKDPSNHWGSIIIPAIVGLAVIGSAVFAWFRYRGHKSSDPESSDSVPSDPGPPSMPAG